MGSVEVDCPGVIAFEDSTRREVDGLDRGPSVGDLEVEVYALNIVAAGNTDRDGLAGRILDDFIIFQRDPRILGRR